MILAKLNQALLAALFLQIDAFSSSFLSLASFCGSKLADIFLLFR